MPVALDHLFICVARGAPEAELLTKFGLTEGPANVHPGQGTANRRFFFQNAMLELLWVEKPDEARNARTAPTKLWDRWSRRSDGLTSPFGIILRPLQEDVPPPFAAWAYTPDYLPPGTCLHIGEADIHEPLWVFLPFPRREQRQTPSHPNGVRQITGITLTSPTPPRSAAADALPFLTVAAGPAHLLTIEFDEAIRGESTDLRPHLPLILKR